MATALSLNSGIPWHLRAQLRILQNEARSGWQGSEKRIHISISPETWRESRKNICKKAQKMDITKATLRPLDKLINLLVAFNAPTNKDWCANKHYTLLPLSKYNSGFNKQNYNVTKTERWGNIGACQKNELCLINLLLRCFNICNKQKGHDLRLWAPGHKE
jgi:hypothetical protein